MKLPKFMVRKMRVTFHMKSGAEIKFKCESMETKKDASGDLIAYHVKGIRKSPLHYVRLDDITAITVIK